MYRVMQQVVYSLEYLMVIGSGVLTVVAEAATNHLAIVLSSSATADVTVKFIIYIRKTILHTNLKLCPLESAVCAFHDGLNSNFLGVGLSRWSRGNVPASRSKVRGVKPG